MPLDARHYRSVMSQFATGVTVVTTRYDGDVHGLTVNAFCSLSLDPPLLLVCLHNEAFGRRAIEQSACFAVNILAREQEDVARRFATRTLTPAERLGDLGVQTATTGAPIFEGVVGWLDCRLHETYPGGDHTIVIGEVMDFGITEAREPLVFFRSRYHLPSNGERAVWPPEIKPAS